MIKTAATKENSGYSRLFSPLPTRRDSPLAGLALPAGQGFFLQDRTPLIPLGRWAGFEGRWTRLHGVRCDKDHAPFQFIKHALRPFVQRLGGPLERSFIVIASVVRSSLNAIKHEGSSRCVTKKA